MVAKSKQEVVSTDEFSQEELDEIRAAARKEIDDQLKAQKRAALKAQYLREERAKVDPDEELVDIQINVPGFASFVMIDGVEYQHGEVRQFTRKQAASVRDIMARAWDHEDSTGNAHRDIYRRPKEATVGANTVVNTRHFARV